MRQKHLVRILLSVSLPAAALAVAGVSGPTAHAVPLCDVPEPPPVCDLEPPTTRRPATTTTLAPDTATWSIDANTLKVNDAQEEGLFSDGDEAYIAQIGFRSTPGRPGSTSAFFQGGLTEIDDLDDGETHTVPDAQGRVRFANVTSRGLGDVLAGRNPEVLGTLSVVFESDATPFNSINSIMTDVARTARTEIAKVIEPLSLADLGDSSAISARLATAQRNIQASATPTTLQAIGLFLSSFGDPDDIVAFKGTVFVAVDSSLAGLIDTQIGMNIPSATGIGGALRDRTYALNFAGDGANYTVSYRVSH